MWTCICKLPTSHGHTHACICLLESDACTTVPICQSACHLSSRQNRWHWIYSGFNCKYEWIAKFNYTLHLSLLFWHSIRTCLINVTCLGLLIMKHMQLTWYNYLNVYIPCDKNVFKISIVQLPIISKTGISARLVELNVLKYKGISYLFQRVETGGGPGYLRKRWTRGFTFNWQAVIDLDCPWVNSLYYRYFWIRKNTGFSNI